MDDKMNSKQVFRNQSRGDDGEQIFSAASKETSIEISLLRTFSCETDGEPTEIFDSKNCFVFDEDENNQTIIPKQEQDSAPIVTPPLPIAREVEISFDPLPEPHMHPFLLDMDDDDQKLPAITESDLLFPLADEDFLDMITTDCKQEPLPEICQEKHEDDQLLSYDKIDKCNLCKTYVYAQLRPSLPLPDSFGPILCLLLHMEFSSTIDGTILTKACEIVNEQWNDETDGLCSNTTKKEIKNVSGKIVDKFVDALGPMVDFPALFQASAQTCNNLSTTDSLSIFFGNNPDAPNEEENESQIQDDRKPQQCASKESIGRKCTFGKKRKSRNDNDEDEKMPAKKRPKFVPSMLQLAIAWANYSRFGGDLSKSDQKSECDPASLEEFVEKTSSRLQTMDSTERSNQWNNLVERWQSRDKTN